jgi:carboxyl-terminal processing protease
MTDPGERKSSPFQPALYALLLVFGIYIGKEWAGGLNGGTGALKTLDYVLDRIDESYLTDVDRGELEEFALEAVLNSLDPHTAYLDPDMLAGMSETMQGNFEGIGVEFFIGQDTLRVVHALPGGPSERAGIQSGDHIVRVNGEEISSPDLTNSDVAALLKGPKGTEVHVGVLRDTLALDFNITRDRVRINSVVSSFSLTANIGYVRVIRFAGTTLAEFVFALGKLEDEGVSSVIVDLRGNGGGMLDAVIPMTELFLEKDEIVLSVEGENTAPETYRTSRRGRFADWPIAVIIDESSASASEILAGAIQDLDRGIVVGRRSFGKGLVQQEFGLPNDGALRLTTSRFHTPSGRAIQKPFVPGKYEAYVDDFLDRFDNGELIYADSMHRENVADSLLFTSPAGRIVYGNGGITPDFFVPRDTLSWSPWINGVIAWDVVDITARTLVERFWTRSRRNGREVGDQELPQEIKDTFSLNCEEAGLISVVEEPSDEEWRFALHLLHTELERRMYGEAAFYRFLAESDEEVDVTRDLMERYDEIEIVDGQLSLAQ